MAGDGVMPIRCPNEKFGDVRNGSGELVVRCRDRKCRREGYVTFHVFNLSTGECSTEHRPYRAPGELPGRKEPVNHGLRNSVRTA